MEVHVYESRQDHGVGKLELSVSRDGDVRSRCDDTVALDRNGAWAVEPGVGAVENGRLESEGRHEGSLLSSRVPGFTTRPNRRLRYAEYGAKL